MIIILIFLLEVPRPPINLFVRSFSATCRSPIACTRSSPNLDNLASPFLTLSPNSRRCLTIASSSSTNININSSIRHSNIPPPPSPSPPVTLLSSAFLSLSNRAFPPPPVPRPPHVSSLGHRRCRLAITNVRGWTQGWSHGRRHEALSVDTYVCM